MDVVNQIKLHGDKISDQMVVEKIMISVPQKFEAKISTIEESCDVSMLTISELTSKLQAQEQRISMRSEEKIEGDFQASFKNNKPGNSRQNTYKRENYKGNKSSNSRSSSSTSKKGTFPPCKVCQNTNHQEVNCWFKDKPNFKCNFCKKFGHIERYCRANKNHGQTKELQLANVTEENQEANEHLFMVLHVDKSLRRLIWLLDSGCNSHMTPELSYFCNLDTKINTKVKLGDGRIVQAKERGTIAFKTK
ncbi:uncharacterized protein [Rutidosis leptorrhynchoides]|uniref:uncharacterized protein n=1 Tax=Rutidosis leptorrhynchoides TaxID=125765 RepID=UPI003A98D4FC